METTIDRSAFNNISTLYIYYIFICILLMCNVSFHTHNEFSSILIFIILNTEKDKTK